MLGNKRYGYYSSVGCFFAQKREIKSQNPKLQFNYKRGFAYFHCSAQKKKLQILRTLSSTYLVVERRRGVAISRRLAQGKSHTCRDFFAVQFQIILLPAGMVC